MKQELSIGDILYLLVKELNFTLKQMGRSVFFLCPFHNDKNPSCSFEPNRKIFTCFSCGFKASDIFNFWAKFKKIDLASSEKEITEILDAKWAEKSIDKLSSRFSIIKSRDEEKPTFKKLLTLNLIPSTSWWKNARSEIPKSEWDRIRQLVYQQANYACEICGVANQRLDCNELWEYKDNKQILTGLEAICRKCHLTQHMGYASTIGKHQEAFNHLLKVNGWRSEWGGQYVFDQFEEWKVRSKQKWELDLSHLKHYGLEFKEVNKSRSKPISKYQKMADEMIKYLKIKKG